MAGGGWLRPDGRWPCTAGWSKEQPVIRDEGRAQQAAPRRSEGPPQRTVNSQRVSAHAGFPAQSHRAWSPGTLGLQGSGRPLWDAGAQGRGGLAQGATPGAQSRSGPWCQHRAASLPHPGPTLGTEPEARLVALVAALSGTMCSRIQVSIRRPLQTHSHFLGTDHGLSFVFLHFFLIFSPL